MNEEELEILGKILEILLGFIKEEAPKLKELMYWSILRLFLIKRSKTEKPK